MTPLPTVVLYGRPGCHLCEEARKTLLHVRKTHPFVLEELDIEADDDLMRRFLERIPVVEIDGRVLFEFFIDQEALEREIDTRRADLPR